jgi:hypothetical protein
MGGVRRPAGGVPGPPPLGGPPHGRGPAAPGGDHPAPWKQLGYLRKLGYEGSPPRSMLEASLLIEELKEGEEPLPT